MESDKINTSSESNLSIKNKKIIKLINSIYTTSQNRKFIFYISFIIAVNIIIIYYLFQKDKIVLFKLESITSNKIINLEKKVKNLENELKNYINKTLEPEDSQNENNNNLNITSEITNGIELEEIVFEEFNEDILNKIKEKQNEFCVNSSKYYNLDYEKKIKLSKVDYRDKSFKLYVYKSEDLVSNAISHSHKWEISETNQLLRALDYYSSHKNISKNNIYVLDIGSNVGWFTFYLGKFGYRILSFEPSNLNMYILRKNYCINNELNITLIKKGLYDEEKRCDFYISGGNIGDGWVFCNKSISVPKHLIKSGETLLTRLSNYVSFLSSNNLAVIKIDVEGSEGKAILSGIELITKYNVPFIFLEFSPVALKLHGTDPKEFLILFEQNGYKFLKDSFFNNNYLSVDHIISVYKSIINVFIVHSSIINEQKN